jgi:chemotaxis protein CheD
MGAGRETCKQVFGGAELFARKLPGKMKIGFLNIMVAEDMLKEESIPIISKSVGGTKGRKIIFNTDSGLVLLKYVGVSKVVS